MLLAAPGRPLGPVLLEQLAGQPQFAEVLDPMTRAIEQIEAGAPPSTEGLPAELATLLTGPASGYLAELIRTDPAELAESGRPADPCH